jgi:mRNA interferase MazF
MGPVTAESAGRGDVFLVSLNPARSDEIQKARLCVIVSPDEINTHLRTVIVAPLTTGSHAYPFRAPCRFAGRKGYVVLDQIRTVDCERLVRKLGKLSPATLQHALEILREMFEQ